MSKLEHHVLKTLVLPANHAKRDRVQKQMIIAVLADTGIWVSDPVGLDWEYFDLDADPDEVYLLSKIQMNGIVPILMVCIMDKNL
jgi:integrase